MKQERPIDKNMRLYQQIDLGRFVQSSSVPKEWKVPNELIERLNQKDHGQKPR